MRHRDLSVSLSFEQLHSLEKCVTDQNISPEELSVNAMRLLVALDELQITDGVQPFAINGAEYTPPTFRTVRKPEFADHLLDISIPSHLYAAVVPFAARDHFRPDQYAAKSIAFATDILICGPGATFTASQGSTTQEVVNLLPVASFL